MGASSTAGIRGWGARHHRSGRYASRYTGGMRRLPLALLAPTLLAACNGDKPPPNTFDSGDTGLSECGRVRGTTGILMYDAASPDTVHYPVDVPDAADHTSGIAGPLGDEHTFLSVTDGQALLSADGGCNWAEQGSLPSDGDWTLVTAGPRAYAFDRGQARGGYTDDLGLSWTPFETGAAFLAAPTASDRDSSWLRGVRDDGVASSTDGGDHWTVDGTLPEGSGAIHDADALASDLDVMALAAELGVWTSLNGGLTWDDHTEVVTAAVLATEPVAGVAAAVSADDAHTFAALVRASDGVYTVARSTDSGASWSRLADSDGIGLDDHSNLWIVPGAPDTVVTTWVEPGAEFPLHLNITVAGEGTHVIKVALYEAMNGMVFGGERWIAAVDAGG